MRYAGYMIADKQFRICEDDMIFNVKLFHFPLARKNEYELYRDGELCAEGVCSKEYTPEKIINYHVRADWEELNQTPIDDEDEMEY